MTTHYLSVEFKDAREDTEAVAAIADHLFETFNDDDSIARVNFETLTHGLTMRALDFLRGHGTDWEASSYPAQAAVEWWILDCLNALQDNDLTKARTLLDTYENAAWSEAEGRDRETYRTYYPRDGECQNCGGVPTHCTADYALCAECADSEVE